MSGESCCCGHPAYFHHELKSCDFDTDDGPCDCDGYEDHRTTSWVDDGHGGTDR